MYRLTCPFCGATRESTFVRLGAMATCHACEKRFEVNASTSEHSIASPKFSEEENPLMLGAAVGSHPPPPITPPPPPPPSSSQSASASASGPRRAAASSPRSLLPPTPAPPPADDPPLVHHPIDDPEIKPRLGKASPDVERLIAQRRAARQFQQRLTIILIACSVVVVLLVVFLIAWLTGPGRDRPVPTLEPPTLGAGAGDVDVRSIDAPIVQARPLGQSSWERLDEAFTTMPTDERVQVTAGSLKRVSDDWATLDLRISLSGNDALESGRLTLVLVSLSERAIGRATLDLPLMMPSRGRRTGQQLVVRAPESLATRTDRVAFAVEVEDWLPGAVAFQEVTIEPLSDPGSAKLLVKAYNPLPRPLARSVFLIQALNGEGEALGQWRSVWARPIDAGQFVEFVTIAPTEPDWRIARWRVTGVGQPLATRRGRPISSQSPPADQSGRQAGAGSDAAVNAGSDPTDDSTQGLFERRAPQRSPQTDYPFRRPSP